MSDQHHYPHGSGNRVQPLQAQSFSILSPGAAGASWVQIRPNRGNGTPGGQVLWAWQGVSCDHIALHRVNSQQQGVIRVNPGGATITSLTLAQIQEIIDSGGDNINDLSVDLVGKLPLKVSVAQHGGLDYSFWMDPNQAVELYASCVKVELWAPRSAVADAAAGGGVNIGASGSALAPPPVTATSTAGTYGDHLTQTVIQQVEASITQQNLKFTEIINLASTSQAAISVPPRAVGFTIHTQDTVAQWEGHIGNPSNGSVPLSFIAFNAAGVATGRVGYVDHLVPDSVEGSRLFEVIWEIQP